ncbi:MAG: hypothetical protein ACOYOU_04775 [Kiritimatiellia bacterium]
MKFVPMEFAWAMSSVFSYGQWKAAVRKYIRSADYLIGGLYGSWH